MIGVSGFLDVGEPLPGPDFIERIGCLVVAEYIESGVFAENDTTEHCVRTRHKDHATDFTSNREQPHGNRTRSGGATAAAVGKRA